MYCIVSYRIHCVILLDILGDYESCTYLGPQPGREGPGRRKVKNSWARPSRAGPISVYAAQASIPGIVGHVGTRPQYITWNILTGKSPIFACFSFKRHCGF